MAATAPPIAHARGPTIVTVTGTTPRDDLAIIFLATNPFVTGYPKSMFALSAVASGGTPQTASVPMKLAIRTWGVLLTSKDPDAPKYHVPTVGAPTFALNGVAFSRILTELAASGLLDAGPFATLYDSDVALRALTVVNLANLDIRPDDILSLEPLDRAAIAAIAAIPSDRGIGRSRTRGAAAAVTL